MMSTSTDTQVDRAQDAFSALVTRGLAPNGISPGDLGSYAETYTALVEAHANGGIRAVRRAWSSLVKHDPRLGALLAGERQCDRGKHTWTVRELLDAEFPDPEWAVPGLLPVGLNSLAGRPKLGKSWMGLQLAHAVGTGGQVFFQPVKQGPVLYLALEDSARRLQARLRRQQVSSAAQITFHTQWKRFTAGGMDDLVTTIAQERYRLIIVDTLSRAYIGADQKDLDEMTRHLGGLQSQAQAMGACVVLIDHHRKAGHLGPNAIDDIIGTTAKAAVLDTALGLYRERGKQGATLDVIGRDVEERTLALEFDGLRCEWNLVGEAGEVQAGTRKAKIVEAINSLHGMGETPCITSIANFTGIDKSNVSHDLADLVNQGTVVQGEKQGKVQPYLLPEMVADLRVNT